jgi:hypothetical protein
MNSTLIIANPSLCDCTSNQPFVLDSKEDLSSTSLFISSILLSFSGFLVIVSQIIKQRKRQTTTTPLREPTTPPIREV